MKLSLATGPTLDVKQVHELESTRAELRLETDDGFVVVLQAYERFQGGATLAWTVHPATGGQLTGGTLTLPARSVKE